MTSSIARQDHFQIRLFTAVISLLLSLQAVYFDDIINRDGIMYLQMIEAYLTGGLTATKVIFDWPFFAIIVAWFHQFTSINIESSAFIVNSLFFVLLTDTLVRISTLLSDNRQQLFIAAILILCFGTINEYRDFIMRDFGYWAFCSLALYHFMLFSLDNRKHDALLWQTFILIAVLFRIEGSVILIALPLFSFYQRSFKAGLKRFFESTSLLFISALVAFGLLFAQTDIADAFAKLSSTTSYINSDIYLTKLTASSEILANDILNKYSDEYATLVLVSGLIAMMLFELIATFSVSYLIVYAISVKSASISPSDQINYLQRLLFTFLLINLAILLAFLLKQYFLSSRYMGMALISLLLLLSYRMSFAIQYLWQHKKRLPLFIAAFALFYSVADTSTRSVSKDYIKDTTLWAAAHIPEESNVMTDDEFVMYYFERDNDTSALCVKTVMPDHKKNHFIPEYNDKFIPTHCLAEETNSYRYFDYLVLVEKRRHLDYQQYIAQLDLEIVYRQQSRKGDFATVYKVIK